MDSVYRFAPSHSDGPCAAVVSQRTMILETQKETDRDIETDRQTDRQTETERQRQRDTERDRDRLRHRTDIYR